MKLTLENGDMDNWERDEAMRVQEATEAVIRMRDPDKAVNKKFHRDPTCPKCGITLGNKMMYACAATYCPVGLN